jgi:hypothetical protein
MISSGYFIIYLDTGTFVTHNVSIKVVYISKRERTTPTNRFVICIRLKGVTTKVMITRRLSLDCAE